MKRIVTSAFNRYQFLCAINVI